MNPLPLSRRGSAATVAAVFLAGFGSGVWWARGRSAAPPPPAVVDISLVPQGEGLSADDPDRLPTVPVLSVVDGDTLEILWNDRPTKLRYYGVNTTERDQACYREGTEMNRALSGGAVRLAFDERTEDKYHRLLAYVFTPDGKSIDAALVAAGMGKAWRRDGRFREQIVSLEDDARVHRRGCLWGADRPGGGAPSEAKRRTSRPRRSWRAKS